MIKRNGKKLRELARSMGVGAIATIVDLLSLIILTEAVGLTPTQSNVPALVLGVCVQFFGNKYFAFSDYSRNYTKQGAQFALVEAGALVLNGVLFHVVYSLTLLPYAAIRVGCSALVYIAYSFPLWRLVFNGQRGA